MMALVVSLRMVLLRLGWGDFFEGFTTSRRVGWLRRGEVRLLTESKQWRRKARREWEMFLSVSDEKERRGRGMTRGRG